MNTLEHTLQVKSSSNCEEIQKEVDLEVKKTLELAEASPQIIQIESLHFIYLDKNL